MSKQPKSKVVSGRRSFLLKFVGYGDALWTFNKADLLILSAIFLALLFALAPKNLASQSFFQMQKLFGREASALDTSDPEQLGSPLLSWASEKNYIRNFKIEKNGDAFILQFKEDALFAHGESALGHASRQWVRNVGDFIRDVPEPYRIAIEGHADDQALSRNAVSYDAWDLSASRARAVLKALNLSAEQIKRTVIMSYGDSRPLYSSRNEMGEALSSNQARNRRVSIRIY